MSRIQRVAAAVRFVGRRAPRRAAVLLLVALTLVASLLDPCLAAAQFAIAGRKVTPQETNFAGVRHTSPRFGLVVQLNHDARLNGDFELTLVDEAYAGFLQQGQTAVLPVDALPVVFVSEAKMVRFGEGGRRRIFRLLEPELRRHQDLHLSPAGIFISDENLIDRARLQSALSRALGFLFDRRFRETLDSIERPTPDR
jgi:hypothetical protein